MRPNASEALGRLAESDRPLRDMHEAARKGLIRSDVLWAPQTTRLLEQKSDARAAFLEAIRDEPDGAGLVELLVRALPLLSSDQPIYTSGSGTLEWDLAHDSAATVSVVARLERILTGPAIEQVDTEMLRTIANLVCYGCELQDGGPNDLNEVYATSLTLDLRRSRELAVEEVGRRGVRSEG
jgi:hypothetical protein